MRYTYELALFFFSLLSFSIAAAPTAPKEGKINVPGGHIWYSIKGQGNRTPILVIHGGPGGSSCSLAPLAKLGRDRYVIFYDQLGAGKSEQPTDISLWRIDRFVEEVSALRQSLGLNKVHLLAHSWGAAIAGQYLVDKGTEGIESVIYAGPLLSSRDWVQSTNQLRKQLSPVTQSILHKHEVAGTTASAEYQRASEEFYAKFLFHMPHHEANECNGSDWNQSIYEHMWGNSEFIVTGNLKGFDVIKPLQQLDIPTLFLVGEFDEVPENIVNNYAQVMPNASVVVIKSAAHMSMVDQPLAFVQAVETFLAKVESHANVGSRK